ncbi:MAG TPA: succinyl-diaminopimelate desuccinylase [Cellulomonadaceae bacterium]|nr:succinyl-diaminopimelate desuccinylase [Cellulomonadaceae bacterium]
MTTTSAPLVLDLSADLVDLTRTLCDVPSVSGEEQVLADAVETALRACAHLEVLRDGNAVIARTRLGRPSRVVIAGHLDTVPIAGNLPSRLQRPVRDPQGPIDTAGGDPDGTGSTGAVPVGHAANVVARDDDELWGRGAVDMKGGVAVALSLASRLVAPARDVTWVFYDNEEVEASRNGLGRVMRNHPEWLAGDFAVIGEPTVAGIEGGCNGTLRVEVRVRGVAAHSARAWTGVNAIHGADEVLRRLTAYVAQESEVDGLTYREGMNAVGIRGGIAGNVIPDECVVTVNFRFAPDRSIAQAEAHVRDLFDGFEVTVVDAAAGARPGLDAPIAADFVAAVASLTGRAPAPKYGWTDVARFSELGVPAVNFGPGDPLLAHKDDERCPVWHLRACHDALLAWLTAESVPGSLHRV